MSDIKKADGSMGYRGSIKFSDGSIIGYETPTPDGAKIIADAVNRLVKDKEQENGPRETP